MSNYRKNYRVILVNKNTLAQEAYDGLGLSEAKKIAKEESLKNNQNVFIYAGSEDDINLLESLSKPAVEFNVLEAYISRLLGELSH